jgi:hypothetical protein
MRPGGVPGRRAGRRARPADGSLDVWEVIAPGAQALRRAKEHQGFPRAGRSLSRREQLGRALKRDAEYLPDVSYREPIGGKAFGRGSGEGRGFQSLALGALAHCPGMVDVSPQVLGQLKLGEALGIPSVPARQLAGPAEEGPPTAIRGRRRSHRRRRQWFCSGGRAPLLIGAARLVVQEAAPRHP